ncbi:hypothetical protein D3C81_1095020 [compost metagenome]
MYGTRGYKKLDSGYLIKIFIFEISKHKSNSKYRIYLKSSLMLALSIKILKTTKENCQSLSPIAPRDVANTKADNAGIEEIKNGNKTLPSAPIDSNTCFFDDTSL